MIFFFVFWDDYKLKQQAMGPRQTNCRKEKLEPCKIVCMSLSSQENTRMHHLTLGHAHGLHMSAEPHASDYCRSDSLRFSH